MGFLSKPKTPPAPDYAGAAREQGQNNIDTARLQGRMNNPNVYTPGGSQTVSWGNSPQGSGYVQDGQVVYDNPVEFSEPQQSQNAGNYQQGGNLLGGDANIPQIAQGQNWGGSQSGFNGGKQRIQDPKPYQGSYQGNGGYPDQPTIIQSLSPDQQNIYDTNERLQQGMLDTGENQLGRINQAFNTPWDTSGAPQVDAYNAADISDVDRFNAGELTNVDDASVGGADRIVQALMERYQPEFDERRTQANNQLLTQGHTRGGSAWDTTGRDLDRSENDFRLGSIVQAGQEQSRLLGEQRANRGMEWGEAQGQFDADMARQAQQANLMQAAQAATAADRGRAIQEQAYNRNVPLNETNALRQGNQIQPYSYQGYQGSNVQPAPLFDGTLAAGNFAQQNYGNKAGMWGDMWGGIGQLGGAAIGAASDRRLKENIKPVQKVGELMSYLFNYIGKPEQYLGFMADEIKQIRPDAVIEVNGYDHVTSEFAPVRV